MKKPHKHAELIKAWADGAEIEERSYAANACWLAWHTFNGIWAEHVFTEYRIKPEQKPDYTSTRRVFLKRCDSFGHYAEMENNALSGNPNNVKFIFDGETFQLKDAEVLK